MRRDHQRRDPDVHAQAIRELVARDKNHPCVVLWSIANEPESDTAEAEDYFRPLFALAPPTRPDPAGRVRERDARPLRHVPGLTEFADVLMINRYYGWYIAHGRLTRRADARRRAARLGEHGKPIIITEYGADAHPGCIGRGRNRGRGVSGRLLG